MLSIQWTTKGWHDPTRWPSPSSWKHTTEIRFQWDENEKKKKTKKNKLQNYNSNSKKKEIKQNWRNIDRYCSSHSCIQTWKRSRRERNCCDPYPRFDSSFSPCLFILALFPILRVRINLLSLTPTHSISLSLSLSLSSRNVQQVINIKDKKNKMTNNKCIVAVDSSNSYLTKLVGVKERRDDVGYREIVIRSTSGRRASFPFSSLSVTYPRYSPTIESGKNGSRTILFWFDSTRLDSIQFDSIRLG